MHVRILCTLRLVEASQHKNNVQVEKYKNRLVELTMVFNELIFYRYIIHHFQVKLGVKSNIKI